MKIKGAVDNTFVLASGIYHHTVTDIDTDMTARSALIIPTDDIAGADIFYGYFSTDSAKCVR